MDQEQATKMIPIAEVSGIVDAVIGWKPELSTVRDWAKTGKINSRKIGGRIFICEQSVQTMLKGKEQAK